MASDQPERASSEPLGSSPAYDTLTVTQRIGYGLSSLSLGLGLGWYNWHRSKTEGHFGAGVSFLTPILILLALHILVTGDDLRKEKSVHPRVYITAVIGVVAGLINFLALSDGLY
jgi:hypothetical protein